MCSRAHFIALLTAPSSSDRSNNGLSSVLLSLPLYQHVSSEKILNAAFILLTLYLLIRIALSRLDERKFLAFARQHNCVKPRIVRTKRIPHTLIRIRTLLAFKGDVLDDLFYKVMQYHGDHRWNLVVKNLQGREMITTADPSIIKTILYSKFCDWEIGRVRHAAFEPFLGRGIFTTDGEMWEQNRAALRPAFARKHIQNMAQYASPYLEQLLQVIEQAGLDENGWTEAADLHNYFLCYAMDVGMEFLCGKSLDSLSRLSPDSAAKERAEPRCGNIHPGAFQDAFDDAHHGMTIRGRLGGFYWLYCGARFQKACKLCKTFVASYVDRTFSEARGRVENPNGRYVLLDELAKATRDRTHLGATFLQMLLATRNTTGTTLAFVIAQLARNPDVFSRLRGEVLHQFGSEGSEVEISHAALKAAKYLQAVLRETLRLYPIIPYNSRTAIRDTVLPTGGGADGSEPLAVKKGTCVGYVVYVMHRRPDIWGPDAAQWKPERWEGRKAGWEYLPFNAGPRVCIGQEFAMSELGYTLVRLLQRYKAVTLGEGVDPVLRKGVRLGVFPKDVIVKFQRASSIGCHVA